MISRRNLLAQLICCLAPASAWGFAEEGAFHARLLLPTDGAGGSSTELLLGATSRWAFELMERTSAPARISSELLTPESSSLLLEPFVLWVGSRDPGQFSPLALRRLAEFFRLGGQMIVDDQEPERGEFTQGASRELSKVLPEVPKAPLPPEHVLFKSFYLLDRPYGRVLGPATVEAQAAGGAVKALYLQHDLLGALARHGDTWAFPVEPGGSAQREMAIRFAINIAMHFLCTDYKDDQVHAPFLMRRRARSD